ncbi:HET-domain-containing protein [Thozetella sp. PMI_491]|nr:HET-domain-containing protein [Thozetella sp. PMI_491]
MRLLNTQTLQLSEFFDDQAPPYAILSHTWSEEEVTLQDVQQAEPSKLSKKGYEKVQECCRQAQRDGIDWAWMDTCCIDKTSSAELSEAINSMYRWYRNSKRCYAYLSDVDREGKSVEELNKAIEASRWFTRGWTLQELIAPYEVDFFDRYWHDIGSKWSLYDCIYEKTAIPKSILRGDRSALDCSVGERISWAAYRRTTREEDRAYSLLGILGINMPLLYGEGSQAFFRLQEQILRQCEDYTLLLWNGEATPRWNGPT